MVVCKRVGERCAQTCFPRGAARPGAGLPARGLRRARGPASLPRHRGSASSPGETSAASGEKRDVEAAPACLGSRARRAGTRGSLAPRCRVSRVDFTQWERCSVSVVATFAGRVKLGPKTAVICLFMLRKIVKRSLTSSFQFLFPCFQILNSNFQLSPVGHIFCPFCLTCSDF